MIIIFFYYSSWLRPISALFVRDSTLSWLDLTPFLVMEPVSTQLSDGRRSLDLALCCKWEGVGEEEDATSRQHRMTAWGVPGRHCQAESCFFQEQTWVSLWFRNNFLLLLLLVRLTCFEDVLSRKDRAGNNSTETIAYWMKWISPTMQWTDMLLNTVNLFGPRKTSELDFPFGSDGSSTAADLVFSQMFPSQWTDFLDPTAKKEHHLSFPLTQAKAATESIQ